jgi:hypothetical protein
MLEVDYDALVRDPEPVVKNITRFLGLEWEESLLDFARTDRAVKTASVWQVREPLYTRSSGRWRNYGRHLEPLRSALAEAGIATDE